MGAFKMSSIHPSIPTLNQYIGNNEAGFTLLLSGIIIPLFIIEAANKMHKKVFVI